MVELKNITEEIYRKVMLLRQEHQKTLKTSCVFWRSPFVEIQHILLDTPPSQMTSTVDGLQRYTDKQYALQLKNWQEEKIGGREEVPIKCDGRYWYPHEDASLYRIFHQTMPDLKVCTVREYYLLTKNTGEHFILMKTTGIRSSLSVLSESNVDNFAKIALQNVTLEL